MARLIAIWVEGWAIAQSAWNRFLRRWHRSVEVRWLTLTCVLMALTLVGVSGMGAIAQRAPQVQAGFPQEPLPEVLKPTDPLPPQSPFQFRLLSHPFVPREEVAPADPTNYGERFPVDIYGNPANQTPIVVLHETVGTAQSAINTFQRRNERDADQVSYHALVRRDGTVVYLVSPEYRAFGAGNSVFDGPNGTETIRTNPDFPASVNNFAFHFSFETPSDGRGNQSRHSGYTRAQYQSLAWLTARTGVPPERVTTHRAVDRSGSRLDPRSFDRTLFLAYLNEFME